MGRIPRVSYYAYNAIGMYCRVVTPHDLEQVGDSAWDFLMYHQE